jgi:general secretion pathway protein N
MNRLQTTQPAATAPSWVWAWAWVGVFLGTVLAVVLHWPAPWLAGAVSKATHGQIQLQEAQGTLWQGSGKLVLTGGAGSRDAMALPGRIHWQLSLAPQGLQLPSVQLQLMAACCMTQATHIQMSAQLAQASFTLQIGDHKSEWPAGLLSGLGAPWNTMQPEGNLVVTTQQLNLVLTPQSYVMQGNLMVTAEDMSSKLSTLRPMGTYQINLNNGSLNNGVPGSTPTLKLTTLSGSLLLSGQGQWQGSQFQFRGEASAVPEHAAALSNLLNIIGRRQGARSLLSLG